MVEAVLKSTVLIGVGFVAGCIYTSKKFDHEPSELVEEIKKDADKAVDYVKDKAVNGVQYVKDKVVTKDVSVQLDPELMQESAEVIQ